MINKIILVFITLIFCSGFRVFSPNKPWNINKSSTAKSKVFVSYDNASGTLENDLPSGDPLADNATITIEQAMDSIFDDFNDIEAAYITLVDTADTDYAAESENRIITITKGTAGGASSGEAKLSFDGEFASDCKISLIASTYETASRFIQVATHEIGHCLGLDHPQETVNSTMSYFFDPADVRLKIDDKMGVTFLYPQDASKGAESSTLGMSCSTR